MKFEPDVFLHHELNSPVRIFSTSNVKKSSIFKSAQVLNGIMNFSAKITNSSAVNYFCGKFQFRCLAGF